MPDYEVPPEVNSGRMYAGLGSASLLDSAAAWQALSVAGVGRSGVSGGDRGADEHGPRGSGRRR